VIIGHAVSFQRQYYLGLCILCTNSVEQQMLTRSTRKSIHCLQLGFAGHETERSTTKRRRRRRTTTTRSWCIS